MDATHLLSFTVDAYYCKTWEVKGLGLGIMWFRLC